MFLILTFVAPLLIFLYHHFTKYNNYWIDKNVPGPKPTFFFGNIKDLALRRKDASEIYKEIFDQYPNEKFVGIFRMRTPTLLVKDLDIIQHLLIKDFNVFMDRGPLFSEKGFGANLFHASKDTWQILRNRFTPMFTPAKLKNMTHLLEASADRLVDYTDKIIQEQPEQELHGIIRKYTIEAIAACAFGLDVSLHHDHLELLKKLEHKIFVLNHKSELEMIYPGILRKLGMSLLHNDVLTFFSNFSKEIIDHRNCEPSGSGHNDFMDLLLNLRKTKIISNPKAKDDGINMNLEITDEVIAGQVFIFYIGGYQSSATATSYLMCHLAYDPHIQDKVVAEIKEVLEMHEGKLTYEALTDLKYMEQVLYETLRMHPVIFNVRRAAAADYKIPGTDITIEKGQNIIIPLNVVNMDPKIYPNPEVFDPERFSDKNARERHPGANLAFGDGPRSCMGYRYANIQIKVCLVKLLSRFRVERSPNTPSAQEITGEPARIITFPKGGFPIRLVKRYTSI